jgi:hypothetical protein
LLRSSSPSKREYKPARIFFASPLKSETQNTRSEQENIRHEIPENPLRKMQNPEKLDRKKANKQKRKHST